MIKVIRNDYRIREKDNTLILQNINFPNIYCSITQAQAIYLALRDGKRDEIEVEKISKYLFEKVPSSLKSVCRFLEPITTCSLTNIKNIYDPSNFLKKKYSEPSKKALVTPRYLVLCLTQHCNRHCLYCYASTIYAENVEKNVISLQEIEYIIDQAYDLSVEGILLTGGEPMLYPDVYEIIKYATLKKIDVYVTTKYRLDIDKLQNIETDYLHITLSIDSHKRNLANQLTGSSTFFDDIIYNMRNLVLINKPFSVNLVITQKNYERLQDTIQFLLTNGAKYISLDYYSCDVNKKVRKDLFIPDIQKSMVDKFILSLIERNRWESIVYHKEFLSEINNHSKLAECSGLFSKIIIDHLGNYLFCDKLQYQNWTGLKNIKEQSLWQHWISDEMYQLRFPSRKKYLGTICYDCPEFEDCVAKNSCYLKSLYQFSSIYQPEVRIKNVCNKIRSYGRIF